MRETTQGLPYYIAATKNSAYQSVNGVLKFYAVDRGIGYNVTPLRKQHSLSSVSLTQSVSQLF